MQESAKVIYVVDDELNIRELIKSYLENEGYTVSTFDGAEKALSAFEENKCDMFIIDIMMPGMDGFSLCREIRKSSAVPVIMVSAKDDEIDKVIGLEIGGDDYVSKPFSPRELVARVRSVFRRTSENTPQGDVVVEGVVPDALDICDVKIYIEERRVTFEENEIELTSKEFSLFLFLAQNKNKVFNREQIISSVWGYDFYGDTRAVDDLIKRLRKKFKDAGSILEIKTVWGYGYKISD